MSERKHFKDLHPVLGWVWFHKFRILLFMLVGMLMGYPYLQAEGQAGRTIFEVLFTAMLFLSTYILCDSRRSTIIALVLGLPAVIAHVSYVFLPDTLSYGLPLGAFIIFYVYMEVSVLRHVSSPDAVDADIIFGAACAYIILGMIFAMAYAYVEQHQPGSFGNLITATDPILEPDETFRGAHFTTFLYFSYTTLTTLGYGDIIPKTPAAQSLTSLEAVAGVLFVGAFVARLVSAYQPTPKN